MLILPGRTRKSTSAVNWQQPVNWDNPLNRGLVSWWLAVPGHAGYGSTTWRDLCGRHHQTLYGTESEDWKPSMQRMGALDLDGTSAEYCETAASVDFDSTTVTILATVQNDNATGLKAIAGRLNSDTVTGYALCVNNGYTYSLLYGGTTVTGATLLGTTWRHIGMVSGGGNNTVYLDGVQDGTSTSSDYTPQSVMPFNLGKLYNRTQYNLDGRLQDVRVYNRLLSANEVLLTYQQWRLNYPNLLHHRDLVLPYSAAAPPAGLSIPQIITMRRKYNYPLINM